MIHCAPRKYVLTFTATFTSVHFNLSGIHTHTPRTAVMLFHL